MDKITLPSPGDLMIFWKRGWPGYVVKPVDDYPAILSIANESAKIAGEDLETLKGQHRIGLAITAIATYCHETDYAKKNLFFINRAFQTIVHEMQYAKRSLKLQQQVEKFQDYYDLDKKRAANNERLMEECKQRSKKWFNESWTQEMEDDYQKWKSSRCISTPTPGEPTLIGDLIKK